jgi:hypothetical protein
MACKGFQYGYNMDLSCRDQVQGMLAWAHNPTALSETSINRFVETIAVGWQKENGCAGGFCQATALEIKSLLERENCRLKNRN